MQILFNILIPLSLAAVVVTLLMMPTLLQGLGVSRADALAGNTLAICATVIANLVAGWLADRFGAGRVLLLWSVLLGIAFWLFYSAALAGATSTFAGPRLPAAKLKSRACWPLFFTLITACCVSPAQASQSISATQCGGHSCVGTPQQSLAPASWPSAAASPPGPGHQLGNGLFLPRVDPHLSHGKQRFLLGSGLGIIIPRSLVQFRPPAP